MSEDRVHHDHDVGSKHIFSHKETFLELLRSFVKKDWVDLIKSEDLVLVNKSYVLEDFREEESDIVYKVDIIFYILLEFQSTVFLLDKEISKKDLIKRLRLASYVLKKITPEQFDILKSWLKSIIEPRLDGELRREIEEVLEKSSQSEVESMVSNLGKTIDNIIREGRKEGREEGREEGRKEGKTKGKSELIIKQLIKKFKEMPNGYIDKINNLSDETLDTIATDIFDMDKVEDLEKYF